MLPETFCEVVLRFFWKKAERASEAPNADHASEARQADHASEAREVFVKWLKEVGWEANRKQGHPQ